jgi:lipopolysaccharide/colanic/teichoic acid biosynthesis glycosyltransferase
MTGKRCFDVVVSAVLLVLASPIMLCIAALIWIFMGRPILFWQERAGRDGAPFVLVKFRSMRPPLREGGEYDNDAERLTRFGRALRSSSLDELPTLVNVLRGDMSLVGPRPLPLHYVPLYSASQRRRLSVLPGITGLAQVSGRNALSWETKLQLDVTYVETQSLLLDLTVLLRTVGQVLTRRGIAMEGHTSAPRFLGSGAESDGIGSREVGETSTGGPST